MVVGGVHGCRGACEVAGGMHGCRGGVSVVAGVCVWLWGACVVVGGGMCGTRRDTVNERAVRILLECILVSLCNDHGPGFLIESHIY